jgi:gliding motility-associated protein GldM
MAGGKLSARQKMINLMYLVFIAMLAMNMDKKVLTNIGLGIENDTETNVRLTSTNDGALENLARLSIEQPDKYNELNEQAKSLSSISNVFNTYLDGVKDKLTETLEDKTNYEKMDTRDKGDEYFFKGDKYTKEGQDFVDNINKFREDVLIILGPKASPEIISSVNKRFNTSDDKIGNKMVKYLISRYEGYPLISTLSNISRLQSGIKSTENDVYGALVGGQMESDVSMTNYDAMVVFEKTAYYPGEQLSGKIVLGKNDPTLKASKVVINGRAVSSDRIKAGQVELAVSAGNIGEHELKGTFHFLENGEDVAIEIVGGKYSVIPVPNQAVISADKMNVVYRGVSNPISISMPGVSENKIKASAPGLSKTGKGKYTMTPPKQREVTINVSATLPNGKGVTSKKLFRVKDIPAPTGTVRSTVGFQKMSKGSLVKSTIGAKLQDFVFDLDVGVSSFSVKVPGKPTINVRGTRFDSAAKRAINKARRGDIILIFNIKGYLKNNSTYLLKKTSEVSIEITS